MNSQYKEEAAILNLFKDYDPLTSRFLDIGAYDGKTFSNTWALAQKGWGGIYVEPAANAFDYLVSNVRTLPEEQQQRIDLLNVGVSTVAGLHKWWYSKDLVATLDEASHEIWKKTANFYPAYVSFITIPQLFDQFCGPFHFINIDAEGLSEEIFRQIPLSDLRPNAVCVEFDKRSSLEIAAYAGKFGYRIAFLNAINVIFTI